MDGQNSPINSDRRVRIPWGFLGSLLLIFTMERAIVRHEVDLGSFDTAGWDYASWASRHKVDRPVLVFGDSLLKFGLLPKEFERSSSIRVANLAIPGGPTWASYFMLKRALESGAKPAAVIVDFKSNILYNDPRVYSRTWPGIASFSESIELSRSVGDVGFLGRSLFTRAIPSLLHREELRTAIMASLRGVTSSQRDKVGETLRVYNENDGAFPLPSADWNPSTNPYQLETLSPADRHEYFPKDDKWEPVNLIYMRRFVELASSRGIKVFIVLTPLNPVIQEGRESSWHDARYVELLSRFQRENTKVLIVDGRHSGYDHMKFMDASHLDAEGAKEYSYALGLVVRQELNGEGDTSRWVMLPPVRSRDANTRVATDVQPLNR